MPKYKVTDLVEEMMAPILQDTDLELVEVEYKKEGANWMLRVFIDRPSGTIDLDDCARVSERLSSVLDEVDPIPNAYFLEVSSAGAERPLKTPHDLQKAVGRRVFLSFYEPFMDHKTIEGMLIAYQNGFLTIQEDAQHTLEIPEGKLASVRLAIEW